MIEMYEEMERNPEIKRLLYLALDIPKERRAEAIRQAVEFLQGRNKSEGKDEA